MNETQKEVLAAVQSMTEAFMAGDIDRVMGCYEGDATVVFEPGAPTADPAQVRAQFEQMAAIRPRFTYAGHEVYVVGDLAIHLAPWKMQGSAPDGAPIEGGGLSAAVLRRDASGQWRIVIDDPYAQHLLG